MVQTKVSTLVVLDVQVFSESDDSIYDPKGKARHARPFKQGSKNNLK